jgi:hypothetical protein
MSEPWHLDTALLDSYATGRTGPVLTASVEAHLMGCPDCRELARPATDPARRERVWAEVLEQVGAPRRRVFERLLVRAGVADSTALLIAATPALSGAWVSAVTVVLSLALFSAYAVPHGIVVFLALAPVLPVLGVALTYGDAGDPTTEVVAASPYSRTRLLFLRSAVVVAAAAVPALLVGVLVPGSSWLAVAWLLPALALSAVTFVLGAFAPTEVVGGTVALAWLVLVLPGLRAEGDPTLVSDASVQLTCLVLLTACAAVLSVRGTLTTGRS